MGRGKRSYEILRQENSVIVVVWVVQGSGLRPTLRSIQQTLGVKVRSKLVVNF